ncbi:hypothetical protein GD1_38 [Paraglaciecola Antarctic GD virus 1]|nr:hypothetical protein GD1_38 [Paraglaciecola Antarctic GD virus 1]
MLTEGSVVQAHQQPPKFILSYSGYYDAIGLHWVRFPFETVRVIPHAERLVRIQLE